MKRRHAHRQRGLTLLECLIGLAVGLGVALAAVQWLTTQALLHRQLVQQARLRQELMLLAGLLQAELRRAPEVELAMADPAAGIAYRTADGKTQRFSLSQGRLTLRLGAGAPQELHDPPVLSITRLDAALRAAGADTCRLVWTLEGRLAQQPAQSHRLEGTTLLPNLTAQACRP